MPRPRSSQKRARLAREKSNQVRRLAGHRPPTRRPGKRATSRRPAGWLILASEVRRVVACVTIRAKDRFA